MMDYAEAFDKWMLWEKNELNLLSLIKGKSSPPANKPPIPSNKDKTGLVFDISCKKLGITDVIRRRNMVRFKNKEDMAFVKLMSEKGSFNNLEY